MGDSQSSNNRALDSLVRFNILGPLRVEDPLGEIALPGLKERTLLCVLLARANQVVSVDELVEGLWGDEPPPTAEKSLQAHVVRLRDALEPQRVRGTPGTLIYTVGPGYVLRCDPDAVDAHRFEGLAREGHAALSAGAASTATRLISQALELWNGQPYGDLEANALDGDRTRLIELERSAREDLAQARLDLGKHRELIPELEQQVVGDPLGERAWAQLMLALYRAGRQSEALDAFHRARGVLDEELGIEPGDDLQRLQRQILDQDPALLDGISSLPVRGLPPELSNGTGPFVAREAELSQLSVLWDRARDASATGIKTVVIQAPDGMGKTRLISEFVRRAASDAVLLYASSKPSTSNPAAIFDRLASAAGRSTDDIRESSALDAGRALGQHIARLTNDDKLICVLDDLDLSSKDARSTLDGFATGLASSTGLLVVTSADGAANACLRRRPSGSGPSRLAIPRQSPPSTPVTMRR